MAKKRAVKAVKKKASGKHVYQFGKKTDGNGAMKPLLGGKGANLAEMTNLGVPVPPGFTIACSVCVDYLRAGRGSRRAEPVRMVS